MSQYSGSVDKTTLSKSHSQNDWWVIWSTNYSDDNDSMNNIKHTLKYYWLIDI